METELFQGGVFEHAMYEMYLGEVQSVTLYYNRLSISDADQAL